MSDKVLSRRLAAASIAISSAYAATDSQPNLFSKSSMSGPMHMSNIQGEMMLP